MSDSITETVLALQAEIELLKMRPVQCPHCLQDIAPRQAAEAFGTHCGFTRTEQRIFEILYRSFGKLVSYEVIFNQLHGCDPNGGPASGTKIINVYFWKIRKKLPACYEIRTIWGRGGVLSMEGR
jgi:DNA-binding response OmpR family regulator